MASWTQSARTNVPYCEHSPSCTEQSINPFIGPNYNQVNTDTHYLVRDDPVHPYTEPLRTYFQQPLSYTVNGGGRNQPGCIPTYSMAPSPTSPSPYLGYRLASTSRYHRGFAPPYAAENVAYSNAPPTPRATPPSMARDAVEPRYNTRPSPFSSSIPVFGSPDPEQMSARRHVNTFRAAARRRNRPSFDWSPPSAMERNPPRADQENLRYETEQPVRSPGEYQRPSVEVGELMWDREGFHDDIWARARERRPYAEFPMRLG